MIIMYNVVISVFVFFCVKLGDGRKNIVIAIIIMKIREELARKILREQYKKYENNKRKMRQK